MVFHYTRFKSETIILVIMKFLADDQGQDLVEYTLLMAFILFTAAGLVLGIGDSIAGITNLSKSQLAAASAGLH